MTRVLGALVYNWPLKLAAIALATLLYAGFVVSRTATDLPDVAIPVRVVNQPAETFLLTNLPPVSQIRYFAAEDAPRPTATTFRAVIDLAGVDPRVGSTFVPIQVESTDPRISVLSFEPPGLTVELERITTATVPVQVVPGRTPDGLEVRPPTWAPETVLVRGPESFVRQVKAVRADVVIDNTPLDVDRDVEVVPVDAAGDAVPRVEAEPSTVRVRIEVFGDRETRSLPVNPVVNGTPAAGYEVVAVDFAPRLVSVEGDLDELVALTHADTTPIDIAGASSDVTETVPLSLPPGVLPLDVETVEVTVTIRPRTGTRTFEAGVVLSGRQAGLDYTLSAGSVQVIVGGPITDLDRLNASAFTVTVAVGGLGSGTHEVTPTASLQAGLSLVAIDPPTITVTVASGASTASPSPSASAGP